MSFCVQANVDAKLAFEKDLESRVERILERFDPYHRVSVNVSFRTLSAPLPGTDLVMSSYSAVTSQLRSTDIQKVLVKVQSSRSPLPDWLSSEIREALKFEGVSVDLEFAPLPQEQLALMQKGMISGDFLKNSISRFQGQIQGIFWLLLAAIVVLVVVGFVFLRLRANQFQKTMQDEMVKLVEGLSEAGGLGHGKAQSSPSFDTQALEKILSQTASKTEGGQGSEKAIENASASSLVSLLTDCYWCGLDDYSAWIWKQIPIEKRTAVLKACDFLDEYSGFLSQIPPKAYGYHEHASYLKSSPLKQVSQEEVKNLLVSHPSLWHELSQMRKDHLQLKIKDRARLSQSARDISKEILAQLKKIKSPLRELEINETISITDINEEREIFLEPNSIPQTMLYSLESLVPLALLPLEERTEILSQFGSQELASAWIGPQEVLEQLEQALPEKKQKILRSYVEKQTPSRNSPSFAALIAQTRQKWKSSTQKEEQEAA